MRIGVKYLIALYKFALCLKTLHDRLVGIFDKQSRVVGNFRRKFTFFVYRANHGDPCPLEYAGVVFAESRRGMHDTRSVLGCNKVAQESAEGVWSVFEVRKKRLVLNAFKFRPFLAPDGFVLAFVFVVRRQASLRQYVMIVGSRGRDIFD